MRKLFGRVLILLLVVLSLISVVEAKEEMLFEISDPVGDDYGSGTYIYPKSEQFKPYEGLFDLTEFKVVDNGENYNLYFKFLEVTNPWHAEHGFSHQLIQLYIDNGEEGGLRTFKKGANVKFEEGHSWNKLVKVTGWTLEVFDYGDDLDKKATVEGDRVKLLADKKTIKVLLSKEEAGDLENAYYYLLIGSLDGFGYDNYREVTEDVEGWKFGGGSKSDINPNVLDILVPEGMDQKEVLGAFDLESGELATLRAVGSELGLEWKFLIIVLFVLMLVGTIVGLLVKYIKGRFNA